MADEDGNYYCEAYLDSVSIGENVFVLGYKMLNDGNQDCEVFEEYIYPTPAYNISMYIRKFESNNLSNPTANFTIGGDSASVYGRAIVAHPMGGIALFGSVCGSHESITLVGPNFLSIGDIGSDATTDMLVARLDESLNLLWAKRYSFGPSWNDICYDVETFSEVDKEGGETVHIYAAGAAWSTKTNVDTALLALYEAGEYVWHKNTGSTDLNILTAKLQFSNTDKAFYLAGMQTELTSGTSCSFVHRFDLRDRMWHLVWTKSSCADGILFDTFDGREPIGVTGIGDMILGNDGMIYLSSNVISNENAYVTFEALSSTDGSVRGSTYLVGDELISAPHVRQMQLSAEGTEVLLVGYYSRNESSDKHMMQGVCTESQSLCIKPYVGTTGRLKCTALVNNGVTVILAGSVQTSTLSTVPNSTETYIGSVELEIWPQANHTNTTYSAVIWVLIPVISFVVFVCFVLYCKRASWRCNHKFNGEVNNGMGLDITTHVQHHCLMKQPSDTGSIPTSPTSTDYPSETIDPASLASLGVAHYQKCASDASTNPTVESFEISPNNIELQQSVLVGKGYHGNVYKARYNGLTVAVKSLKTPQNVCPQRFVLLSCEGSALYPPI